VFPVAGILANLLINKSFSLRECYLDPSLHPAHLIVRWTTANGKGQVRPGMR
jgi:hypothetical protein